jgi:hypothetical protein
MATKLRYVWCPEHMKRGRPDDFDVDKLETSRDQPHGMCATAA